MRIPKQLITYGAGEGLAKGLNILLTLLLARLLTTDVYGSICLLISVELIVTEIILMGQHTVILRLYEKHKKNIRNTYKASLYIMALAASIILSCDALGLLSNFKEDYNVKDWVIPILIVAIYINCNILIFLAFLRMSDDVGMYNILRLLFQVIKLCAVVWFSIYLETDIAYPGGVLLAATIVFGIFFRKIESRTNAYANSLVSKENILENVRVGFPLAVHTTIGTVYSQLDRFMVGGLMSESDIGIYNYSLTIGTSIFFLINVLALYFVPRVYGQPNFKDAKLLLNKFFITSVVGVSIIGLFVYFAIYPILNHWVTRDFTSGNTVVIFGILSVIVHPLSLYGLYSLTYIKKVKLVPFITALALLLNYLISSQLIPAYGIDGAAFTVFFTELIYGVIMIIFSLRGIKRFNEVLSV